MIKQNIKSVSSLAIVIALGGLFLAGPASAYNVTVDQLTIYKNGNLYINDEFNDGNAPPASGSNFGTGTTPATYQTFGAWTENGGRAVANSANSPAVSNSPFDSNTTNRHTARINSNTQPLSQSTNGLKIDDNIAVYGLFDLSSTLDKNDSSYNIRLRDSGFGQSPNDDARVGVRRTDSGNLIVRFGDFDSDAGTFNILDSDVFAPDANDDQIVLALSRSAPDGGNTNPGVTASYAFVDGTVDLSDMVALSNLSFTSLNGAVTLFGDEDWTRADIAVFEAVEVAEPGMIAIILAAVGVMGIARRRQQT
ncbi:MAG: hypothetical protein ACI9JL_004321 [Paracoccaceae bacterium]|jgi:hypothetical protein